MHTTTKKINDFRVEVFDIKKPNLKPKGSSIFSILYPNIILVAKQNSGKTMFLYNILKHCIDPSTKVHIYCSTADLDYTWLSIQDYLRGQGNEMEVHHSIFKDGNRKKTLLDTYLKELEELNKGSKQKNGQKKKSMRGGKTNPLLPSRQAVLGCTTSLFTSRNLELPISNPFYFEKKCIKVKDNYSSLDGPKFMSSGRSSNLPAEGRSSAEVAPKHLFIFDDLSSETKHKDLAKLLKQKRHYNAMVIISTQYPKDIPPDCRDQIDYVLTFAGHKEKNLQALQEMVNVPVNYDQFLKMYNEATREQYNFLYCNCRQLDFRKNIDEQFIVT